MTPFDVAVAVETALAALAVTTDIRSPAAVDAQRDAAALAGAGIIIITPETETWKTVALGKAQLGFAIRVTLVRRGNGLYADRAALSAWYAAREAVRTALLKAGIAGAAAGYEPDAAYDVQADMKNHRISRQRFTYLVVSDRSN